MPTLTVDQVLSGASLGLNFGFDDLLVLDLGGQRSLYGLSRSEGTLVRIDVAGDGTLSAAESLALVGTFTVGIDPQLAVGYDAAGSAFLAVAGLPASTGQTVQLGAQGSLGGQQVLSAAGTLVAPVAFTSGSLDTLVTGRAGAGGVDLLIDTGSGFGFASALDDAPDRYLGDVAAAVSFSIVNEHFLATASSAEDGVNLARISGTTLVHVDALGAGEGLPINTPREMGVIQRLGETLLVVGSFDTSSLSVIGVEAGEPMRIADHILDSSVTRFQNAGALDTVTYGDFAFMAAGGSDGGVSLITLLPGGRMVHLDSLLDDATTTFYRPSGIELSITGDRLDLLVTSTWEAGITRLGYDLSTLGSVVVASSAGGSVVGTALDDQIVGSDLADMLDGGAGDDIIFDGTGEDVLTGGSGADLFVLHPDGQSDTVTDFDPSTDRLDLSAFDFLYDVSQVSIVPTANGAVLSHGAETIVIQSASGAPLTTADFTNATILNVDRPPFLPIAQDLFGGILADTLNGAAGADTIDGAGGDDVLSGLGGGDVLIGGDGLDLLLGGSGDDTLSGDGDADTLVGGMGDDLLNGGAGDDVIYADDWPGF